MNALKLFSIDRRRGTIFVELQEKRLNPVVKALKSKIFEDGECD